MESQYNLQIFLVVAIYWTVSIVLVFTNKYLVEDPGKNSVDISMFICWVQCLCNIVILLVLQTVRMALRLMRGQHSVQYKSMTWTRRLRTMRKISVVSFTYIVMLYLNNLCLKSVGVSFYNTARSMTLVFTALFSNFLLQSPVSAGPFLCCIVVVFGFLLGIDQENDAGDLKIEGLFYGLMTSVFGSLNVIYIKKTLEVVSYDKARFTLYNNINAAIIYIPLIFLTGEVSDLSESSRISDLKFWWILGASGFLSLTIAWVSAVQIDLTSPLTHNVSANSKAVLQSLIAVFYFRENKPALWWLSIVLVALGSTAYAILRIRQERKRKIKITQQKRVSIHRLRSREESLTLYNLPETADILPETASSLPQTPNSLLETPNFLPQTANSKPKDN